MKPSRYEAVSRVFPDRVACLDLRLFQAFAKQRGAAHALGRTAPHLLGELLIEIDGFLSRRHAGYSQTHIRQFAESKRAHGNQYRAIARSAYFEGLVGKRVVNDTD